jgi:hypothetical protein
MRPRSPTGQPSANGLTPGSVRELASGVDSLYLSGWADLPDSLLARLEVGKKRARAVDAVVPFYFGGIEFGLAPYGLQKYEYWLSHEYGALAVTSSTVLPPLRWQPRSEFLQGLGVESSVEAIRSLLSAEVGLHRLCVSRVDLFSDWQGWPVSLDDEMRFVRRARHLATDVEGDGWTGFTFGRRTSKSIGGRAYDKTAEIAQKGNPMWLEIWKERYVPDHPVIRVEFEFHRTALFKEFGLDTPEDVLAKLGELWGYATQKWLTHREPSEDLTRSRWPVSVPWQVVQHPSFRGDAIGLERATSAKTQARLANILPVLRGCFTSASALWGADSTDDGMRCLTAYLHDWEFESGHTIEGEIALKRQCKGWGL